MERKPLIFFEERVWQMRRVKKKRERKTKIYREGEKKKKSEIERYK